MRLWVSRNSEVSVREQLATQIILAISSNVLEPGERLPSTRSLSRRLGIHSNTVSAAFRDLARRGWVKAQKGSGVFVRSFEEDAPLEGELELDRLVRQFIESARQAGFSLVEIRARVAHSLGSHPPDHFLLIEDDPELRGILRFEIESKTGLRVEASGIDECKDPARLVGATVIALYGKAATIRTALPPGYPCLWLRSRSVSDELSKSLQLLPADVHLAVASSWPEFLDWARTILLAAGVDPDSLSFHDARQKGWEKALRVATVLVADARLSARLKPAHASRCYTFGLLSESTLDALREHARKSFARSEPAAHSSD